MKNTQITKRKLINDYVAAHKLNSKISDDFDSVARLMSNENSIIHFGDNLLNPYDTLINTMLTLEEAEWIDWYCFETKFGAKSTLTYKIDGKQYTPSKNLDKFLDSLNLENLDSALFVEFV
jgi:hypothetical protein